MINTTIVCINDKPRFQALHIGKWNNWPHKHEKLELYKKYTIKKMFLTDASTNKNEFFYNLNEIEGAYPYEDFMPIEEFRSKKIDDILG